MCIVLVKRTPRNNPPTFEERIAPMPPPLVAHNDNRWSMRTQLDNCVGDPMAPTNKSELLVEQQERKQWRQRLTIHHAVVLWLGEIRDLGPAGQQADTTDECIDPEDHSAQ